MHHIALHTLYQTKKRGMEQEAVKGDIDSTAQHTPGLLGAKWVVYSFSGMGVSCFLQAWLGGGVCRVKRKEGTEASNQESAFLGEG